MNSNDTNVYLVTGTDEAMIANEARKLVHTVAGENPDPFAFDVIREQDDMKTAETINLVVRSLLSPSLLGGSKTVWLQNFKAFDNEGAKTSRTPDAVAFQALAEVIQNGLPPDMVLIITGPGADQRKGLFRACKAKGKTQVFNKPEVRSRNWEAQMRSLIAKCAADKGLTLPNNVCSHLVDVLGTDTARVDSELEKLICYCGGIDTPPTLAQAQEVCVGQGEAINWALTDAIGARNLDEALRVVDVLSRQDRDADQAARRMLGQTARFFRNLLQVRIFMQQRRLRDERQVQSAAQTMEKDEQQACVEQGLEFITFHPYRILNLARHALNYDGRELVAAIPILRDADWKTVSSATSRRVVLEEALIRLVGSRAPRR